MFERNEVSNIHLQETLKIIFSMDKNGDKGHYTHQNYWLFDLHSSLMKT